MAKQSQPFLNKLIFPHNLWDQELFTQASHLKNTLSSLKAPHLPPSLHTSHLFPDNKILQMQIISCTSKWLTYLTVFYYILAQQESLQCTEGSSFSGCLPPAHYYYLGDGLINLKTFSAKCCALPSASVACKCCCPPGWLAASRKGCTASVILLQVLPTAGLQSSCSQAPGPFSGCWCSVDMQLVGFCFLAIQYLLCST